MQVVQAVNGTFHHFDLARELEARGYLKQIYSGFPWRRLAREGVSRSMVTPLPWLHTALFLTNRYLRIPHFLQNHFNYLDFFFFDRWVASRVPDCDVFVALSGSGLQSGRLVKQRGGKYVCDRGSSHIRYQDAVLREEFARWGVAFPGIDSRIVEREEAEYAAADAISVPSQFAKRSFIAMGVPEDKIVKIPYGVQLSRFQPTARPPADKFEVLFAGTVSLRKGFPYLIQAFQMLEHPRKRLRLVGSIDPMAKPVLDRMNLQDVEVPGGVTQEKLAEYMSGSHVMVLPSIEEGLALVQAQAMACGCPLVSSAHTGAEDLIQDGIEGFLVPIRSPAAIRERLEQLAGDDGLRQRMSAAALSRVRNLGGWSDYGEKYAAFLKSLMAN